MNITFVTGGSRSGKTAYTLKLAQNSHQPCYIATATVTDSEMQERIDLHKDERKNLLSQSGREFLTIEEPYNLSEALAEAKKKSATVAVVDCLTLWINNLLWQHHNEPLDNERFAALVKKEKISRHINDYPQVKNFLQRLQNPPLDLILVGNEVGMGIVPPNPMARFFGDMNGKLNQAVAAEAGEVFFMVSGIPLKIK